MRVVLFVVLFLASLGAIFAGLPRNLRHRARLKFASLLVGCITLGAVAGILFGRAFGPEQGGPFVGAITLAAVGFFAALSVILYQTTNHPEWRPPASDMGPMPLAVAIAIPLCAAIAAPIGWLLPIDDRGERAFMPFPIALLGALAGAVFGIVYEKGWRAVIVLAAFALLVAIAFGVISWLGG